MARPCSICQECIYSRMGTPSHKQCPHPGSERCANYTVHACGQCSNMAKCPYIIDVKKHPEKYDFIQKHEKTTANTIVVIKCDNFKAFAPRPKTKPKTTNVFEDLFEEIIAREHATEFI